MILVTGCSGFIGKRLVCCLRQHGAKIRLLSKVKHFGASDVITCDFTKDAIPESIFANVDVVFHLAGYAHDIRGKGDVEDMYRTVNIDSTVQLAKLASSAGVRRFIFVSSVKAGGDALSLKEMTENDQSTPNNIYGQTKREAELKILEIGLKSKMHVVIIRPALVYGPGVKGNLRSMIKAINAGWFPPIPKTGNRRSMIHVDDLVEALLLLSEDKRANGNIYIVTDGQSYSTHEVYNILCQTMGKSTPRWSIPSFCFQLVSQLSPNIRDRVNKLMGDEFYSSRKIEDLGFSAKKTLADINRSDFL
ncbi:MAG: NAD-dependent epimerase/dehydratase family protein [Bdellovibrionales bacterium]|jgi:UDP-glucose 4-epimerase|nr:NAD-dependent epimerase/dehydratase family protein [Bdellovibrionales bacterium]MBT3525251.1 NAD-dependent epimerase/dehydratase family protein [Bdellovibrionales bacterium]MBT7668893.1 NAD-dependent epimerase/dehydratase family protein [Bdellovibrionales bacterium]